MSTLHMDKYQLLTYLWGVPVLYYIVCDFCNHQSGTSKKKDLPWWQASFVPNSSYLSKLCSFFILYVYHFPYKHMLLMLCSDPLGKENKLSLPSWEIMDSALWIPTIREKEQGHFSSANSGLALLTPLLTVGGSWGICRSKDVSSLYFFIFHITNVWLTWPCFDHVLTISWQCLDHVLT